MERSRAEQVACKIVNIIWRDWGGQKLYIPTGRAAYLAKRNAEIAHRWNGRNTGELCCEFHISETRLRTIVAAHRSGSSS